jgi:hypothetical protein
MRQYSENQAAEGRDRARKMVGQCLDGLVYVFTLASHRGEETIKECLLAIGKYWMAGLSGQRGAQACRKTQFESQQWQ